jgi:hypothetical protein
MTDDEGCLPKWYTSPSAQMTSDYESIDELTANAFPTALVGAPVPAVPTGTGAGSRQALVAHAARNHDDHQACIFLSS